MSLAARTLIAVAVLGASPTFAQTDSGAELKISFADAKSEFHVGETIPVELTFSASGSGYYFDPQSYDRSGRLNIERFHLAPAGRDPLSRYYGEGAFIGGGLSSGPSLLAEPQTIREDLNEWVVLDEPGHYTLYVTSARVSRLNNAAMDHIELQSNSLDFDIVPPTPAWQNGVLTDATIVLDNRESTDAEINAALRTLRFLDSTASIHELVRQLGKLPQDKQWNCVAGLAGSRNLSLVVSELNQQVANPEQAISQPYLFILAKLQFALEHDPLPPYPEKDSKGQPAWQAQAQARQKAYQQLDDSLYRTAAELVANKQGAARSETVFTILMRPTYSGADIQLFTTLPRQDVVSAFPRLSQDQQSTLLSSFWERLNFREMVPALERVLDQPKIANYILRDVALQRLYELDPERGRARILQEIANPHVDDGGVVAKAITLALLPDQRLPQFDDLLVTRIVQKDSRTRELDVQLIGRYATATVLPRVKSIYESELSHSDCATQDGFILYFLRAEPAYGVKLAAKGVSVNSCLTQSFPALVRMKRWHEVEPSIIAQLNNPDLNRARNAAETLAKYGSPAAEEAIWKRLKAFHDQWAEREDELRGARPNTLEASNAISFQYGLANALGTAQGWVLSGEQIAQLEKLTLGDERRNVEQWHPSSPVPISISLSFDGPVRAHVENRYSETGLDSLLAKLAQYSSGTQFSLTAFGSEQQLAPVMRSVNQVAAEHGLLIETSTEQ